MTTDERLATLEAAYLRARGVHDRLDVARVTGDPTETSPLEAEAAAALATVRAHLADLPPDGRGLDAEDARALAAMRTGIDAAAAYSLPGTDEQTGEPGDDGEGTDDPNRHLGLVAAYASAADRLPFEGRVLTRRQVLLGLASEPDSARRRTLFLALEPLWHAVDGDGGTGSPYRAFIGRSAVRWRSDGSPIATNARAIGVTDADIESWAVATLAAWRAAHVDGTPARHSPPIEPWDWWWLAGEAHRRLSPALPPTVVRNLNRAVYASLGADPEALGIRFDLEPRPGRAPVPVAFATFDGRPHRRPDGTWSPGRPTILATCVDGGLDELTELVHETGHAIHLAGIRTRPAFADWPDSDALTEALAELVSLDLVDPAWQRRWVPGGIEVPEAVAVRSRYAEIALDAAWALFEIRLHATPDRRASDVWTGITGEWLGIAPHPEWSWWAIRGQLVEEPGYMANYAVGAVLASDLRAAIRAERGDWTNGDPGWYPWVREHIYRFGLERCTKDVLHGVLGRPPSADALLREVARGPGG